MDTSKAVWFVIHVRSNSDEHFTARIGQMKPDGSAVDASQPAAQENAVQAALKLCVAKGMEAPFELTGFGPFTEEESLVMYSLFDGEKMNDEDNRKLMRAAQARDPHGLWFDARNRDN